MEKWSIYLCTIESFVVQFILMAFPYNIYQTTAIVFILSRICSSGFNFLLVVIFLAGWMVGCRDVGRWCLSFTIIAVRMWHYWQLGRSWNKSSVVCHVPEERKQFHFVAVLPVPCVYLFLLCPGITCGFPHFDFPPSITDPFNIGDNTCLIVFIWIYENRPKFG